MTENLPATNIAGPLRLGDQEAIELGRLEAVVDEALGTARTASTRAKLALQRIRDQRLYRADFSSFEDYVVTRWRVSKTTAYRWIDQGRSLLELEAGDPPEENARIGHGEDVSAGQRVPPWDVSKPDGPLDVPSMELDEGGQGILDTPDVLSGKSGKTPRTTPTKREGDGGQKPDGSSETPGAHLGAAPAAEKAGEAKLEVPKPTRSSTPSSGEDTGPPVPSPPDGPHAPTDDEVRDALQTLIEAGRVGIARACTGWIETIVIDAREELDGALWDMNGAKPVNRPAPPPKRQRKSGQGETVVGCRHPVSRRIGSGCADCGATVGK